MCARDRAIVCVDNDVVSLKTIDLFFIYFVVVYRFMLMMMMMMMSMSQRNRYTEERPAGDGLRKAHFPADMGRAGLDGPPIRSAGPADVVGILVGHNGADHLLCNVRDVHGCLCLLCPHQTGNERRD